MFCLEKEKGKRTMSDQSSENQISKIAVFKGREIRKTIYEDEWWFSVIDVIGALTDSVNARDYWFKMKVREKNDADVELSTICRQLKLEAPDGKMRETDCANTEGIFRIIQSIPSPKAEPFKRWLAKVGYERIQEIENPELAVKRMRATYPLTRGIDARLQNLRYQRHKNSISNTIYRINGLPGFDKRRFYRINGILSGVDK